MGGPGSGRRKSGTSRGYVAYKKYRKPGGTREENREAARFFKGFNKYKSKKAAWRSLRGPYG